MSRARNQARGRSGLVLPGDDELRALCETAKQVVEFCAVIGIEPGGVLELTEEKLRELAEVTDGSFILPEEF